MGALQIPIKGGGRDNKNHALWKKPCHQLGHGALQGNYIAKQKLVIMVIFQLLWQSRISVNYALDFIQALFAATGFSSI